MQFSPTEFIIATTCKDRTVRFWDLEDFGNFDTCNVEATAANCSCFQEDGELLFAAYQDSLKSYSHDPVVATNVAEAHWGTVADMTAVNSRLVTCALNTATVSLWLTDSRASRPVSAAKPAAPGDTAENRGTAAEGAAVRATSSSPGQCPAQVEERASLPAAETGPVGTERKLSGRAGSSSSHGVEVCLDQADLPSLSTTLCARYQSRVQIRCTLRTSFGGSDVCFLLTGVVLVIVRGACRMLVSVQSHSPRRLCRA